jgi:hypothetical protein
VSEVSKNSTFIFILPFLKILVGKPILVERTGNPTEEQVDELHARYMEELVALFDRHKNKYYPSNIKLKIF